MTLDKNCHVTPYGKKFNLITVVLQILRKPNIAENARLQENTASAHLSHIINDSPQLCPMDSDISNLLLRVRRLIMGYCETRCKMYRMWREVPRKMQGPAQRRLFTE